MVVYITDGKTDKVLAIIPKGHFWDDVHYKSLKDTMETYEFTTFANERYSEFLTDMNRIIIPDEDGRFIEFVIEGTRTYREGASVFIDVYTVATYLNLKKLKVIEPQTFRDQNATTIMDHTLAGTGWLSGVIEGDSVRTFVIENNTNPYDFSRTIANEMELELNFRVEIKTNKVVARYADLRKRVGEWRGRLVEFGKDLVSIERKYTNADVVTALIGYGPQKQDGTRLSVLVEDEDALQRWGHVNPDTGKKMHYIEEYVPQSSDTEMTLEQLKQYTRTELNKRINAAVEYVGDISDLEKIIGFENKKIRFGDTIRIKDTGFNPPLYLEARVHTLERSISDKTYKKFNLGDYIEYSQEEVDAVWRTLQNQIKDIKNNIVYKVEIISTNGIIFKNDNISTTLEAHVYHGTIDVTETIDASRFRWTRISDDKLGDVNWNNDHLNGSKTITITSADVDKRATFNCEILEDV